MVTRGAGNQPFINHEWKRIYVTPRAPHQSWRQTRSFTYYLPCRKELPGVLTEHLGTDYLPHTPPTTKPRHSYQPLPGPLNTP